VRVSGRLSHGEKTCLPMQLAPANFLVIRIGSQHSSSERYDRSVVPAATGRYPLLKHEMMHSVYRSSSAVHLPFRSIDLVGLRAEGAEEV